MRVSIERPADYEIGAWRAHILLKADEMPEFFPDEYPFTLPRLPARLIVPESGYRSAPVDPARSFDGMFVRGEWFGDVYSNGCCEEDNPTPIKEVKRTLRRAVRALLAG